jgi:hypothetical protein
MKKILLTIFILITIKIAAQESYPGNLGINGLEKNMLFNAPKRYTVTQQGEAKQNLNWLFDGYYNASYAYNSSSVLAGPSNVDPTIITIEGLVGNHVQKGAWIGWSTRYWAAKRFKIEAYNVYPNTNPAYPAANTWFTIIADSTNTNSDILVKLTGCAITKIRYTFYEGSGTNGSFGISELFYIHPEGAQAYDGLMPKLDKNLNLVLGSPTATLDSTKGDLTIFSSTADDNKASLRIGYNETYNLEIFRDKAFADIHFKSSQANTGHMRFETSNSNFTFNGGKVGIGTLSPDYNLHVNGTGNFTSRLNLNSRLAFPSTNSSNLWNLDNLNGSFRIFRENFDGSAGSIAILIGDNKNVGIGTSSPSEKLSIYGITNSTPGIISLESSRNDAQNVEVGSIKAKNTGIEIARIGLNREGGSSTGFLSFHTKSSNTSPVSEVMRITGSGNVGIGTTNPSAALDVKTTGNQYGIILRVPSHAPWTTLTYNETWNATAPLFSSIAYNTGKYALGTHTNAGDLAFYTNGYGNERLTIKQNGQVIIGVPTVTSIPLDYKLAVAGNIIAEKVKVKKQSSGWPDFVFEPQYKLPDLLQLESFVKQNKHLPEIPSASEIEKDGQDLGEMNRLLLQKVEELTLYLIELKKSNDNLINRVRFLEKNKF